MADPEGSFRVHVRFKEGVGHPDRTYLCTDLGDKGARLEYLEGSGSVGYFWVNYDDISSIKFP